MNLSAVQAINKGGIMNNKTNKSIKSPPQKAYLIIGIVWLVLGFFGLIFDPTKKTMIIIQLVLGSVILVYYFWLKLK